MEIVVEECPTCGHASAPTHCPECGSTSISGITKATGIKYFCDRCTASAWEEMRKQLDKDEVKNCKRKKTKNS